MVLSIAVLAAASLWMLRRVHNRQAHLTATQTVLHIGRLISARLADEVPPGNAAKGATEQDWSRFSRLVQSLHLLENGLQYVSVIEDGVTVFHEQTGGLKASGIRPPSPLLDSDPSNILLGRKRLVAGDETLPVVTFTVRTTGQDDKPRVLEVALRKDTVERKAMLPTGATVSMFRVSLITVLVAFTICVAAVVWMMHREVAREKHRREEEHLAFAGVMAGGVVHDFRNPMSSLRLDIQLLGKEARKGEEAESGRMVHLADRATRTMDRMDKTFQEFTYLSKEPAGRREAIRLEGFVHDCIDMLAPRFEQNQVSVSMKALDGDMEVLAYAMPLRRALLNVLTNARQLSPPGGAVEVRLARAGRHAAIDILDSGPGIPKTDHKRAFELFYSTRPGGSGLGLFLAKKAIEKCEGTILAANRDGGGTRISIRLPLAATGPRTAQADG